MEDASVGVPEDKFITMLKKLDLYKYYPDKLARDDVLGFVNEEFDDRIIEGTEELCKFFLHRLSSCNYKACELEIKTEDTNGILTSERNKTFSPSDSATQQKTIKQLFGPPFNQSHSDAVLFPAHANEHQPKAIHPLDVIISIFLCSDPILKQDIANLLWKCKLAIPFITQTHIDDIPIAHVWPLMSICSTWSYKENGKMIVKEDTVVSPGFLTIGFIRFQSTSVPKSSTINTVMSDTNSIHPIFYNRDVIGSIRRREITSGMVEISWYLPNGSNDNMCHEPVTILNLRGNSAMYPKQLQVLVEMVSILVIVCPSEDLTDENNQKIVEAIRTSKPLIIITHDEKKTICKSVRQVETNFLILNTADLTKAKLKEHINSFLKEQRKNESIIRTSIENFIWADIYVDQSRKEIKEGLKQADLIINLLDEEENEPGENGFLPLHQRLWRNWVEADKEIHRLKKLPREKNIDKYRREKEMEKVTIREKQSQILDNKLSEVIKCFLGALSIEDRVTRIVSVRWLRIQLDKRSRIKMQELLDEEIEIKEKIKCIANQAEKETFQNRREHLQEMKNKSHIGIEHLFRELGQIYEAIQATTPEKRHNIVYDLPLLAAQFLLDGNALEIFDGDVGSVPITWISSVFERVSRLVTHYSGIKDPKCSVLTVYGMQSSGKSTLLNTMFGCQFSVSAGRCTRGAQVQMLKVTDIDHKHINVDYILLIDTEGVRSPDIQEDIRKLRDNEITTFVVGLGDKTLINLLGENTSYLTEVLPITVRSFLRMESVGLHPSCVIVYQNVDSLSETKMLKQNKNLKHELDTQTKIACQMETKHEKRFKEVIAFNVKKDIHYIPSLWEGEQPMSPIGQGYSKAISKLKRSFKTFWDQCKSHDISEYSSHIKSLWTSITKDDFVYFFRNTLETEARERLDKFWCSVVWDLRMKARQCESELHTAIMNSPDLETLEENSSNSQIEIRNDLNTYLEKLRDKMKNFFKDPPGNYEQYMGQWETSSLDDLSSNTEKLIEELQSEIVRLHRLKDCQMKVETEVNKFKKKIENDIAEFFKEERKLRDMLHGNLLRKDEIKKEFDAKWMGWLRDVEKLCKVGEKHRNISREAIDIMREKFASHKALVLQKSDILSSGVIHEFKLREEHLITKSGQISGEIKIQFQQIVYNAMEKVGQRLRELTRDPSPYTKGSIEEIIKIVSDIGDITDEYGVGTTNEFKIEIAMAAASMAVVEFTESEKAFFESFEPKNLLEKEKKDFFILFKINYEKASFTRSFAKRVSELLITAIRAKIDVDFVRKVGHTMKAIEYIDELYSKQYFTYTILCEIAQEGTFRGFMDYIENPSKTIDYWLGKYYDKYSSPILGNPSKLHDLLESFVKDHKDNIEKYVKDTAKALSKRSEAVETDVLKLNDIDTAQTPNKGENAAETEVITLYVRETAEALSEGNGKSEKTNPNDVKVPKWVEEFTDRASKMFVVDGIRRLSQLFVNDSVDLQYFSSELLTHFKTNAPRLDELTTPGNKVYNKKRKEVVASLRDMVVGCTEACPFCGELCISSNRNHAGKHGTPVHRPQGCAGYADIWNRKLVEESCQILVANPEKSFMNNFTNGEFVLYKDYATIYDKWNIIGDPNPLNSSFWEWFFLTYIEDLEKEHHAVRPTIPEVWKTYTKQQEIEKLKNELKTLQLHGTGKT